MKNILFKLFYAVVLGWLSLSAAYAYQTNIATRTCANKKASDDIFIYSSSVNVPSSWSSLNPPLLMNNVWDNHYFTLYLIDNTVELKFSIPKGQGITKSTLNYASMDWMHGATSQGPNKVSKLNFKFYVGWDYLWIEVRNGDSLIAPVYNTVFFVGMNYDLWHEVVKVSCNNLKFANQEELKNDIDKNYSQKYFPGRTPPMIEYSKKDASALLNLLNAE